MARARGNSVTRLTSRYILPFFQKKKQNKSELRQTSNIQTYHDKLGLELCNKGLLKSCQRFGWLGLTRKLSWTSWPMTWGLTGSAVANNVFHWLSRQGATELTLAVRTNGPLDWRRCRRFLLTVYHLLFSWLRNSVFPSCLQPFLLPVTLFRGYSDDFSCL